jgi:glucan endo-1,3-alpha-glucosidase
MQYSTDSTAGWLHLIRHYAQAYRTGTYHSARDSLYLWSRPHPKSGNPTNVSPGLSRPRNADYTEDNLYVVAILSSASDVVVTAGTNTITYKNLPAGLNKISVASGEGSIGAQIVRGGATVRNYSSGTSFKWSRTFRDWSFNYFVASAE